MNILFFLTPKSDIAYIFENETLRQTLEKMEHRKFSCIPILNPDGKYVGTISEGDLLWGMKNLNITDMKTAEEVPVMAISRRATYKPVHVDCDMEDLLDTAFYHTKKRQPLSHLNQWKRLSFFFLQNLRQKFLQSRILRIFKKLLRRILFLNFAVINK